MSEIKLSSCNKHVIYFTPISFQNELFMVLVLQDGKSKVLRHFRTYLL